MSARVSERIAGVAFRYEKSGLVCSLPAPNRHHHIIRAIIRAVDGTNATPADCTQGFITAAGRFVDRREARRIAAMSGQAAGGDGDLFSEDVW